MKKKKYIITCILLLAAALGAACGKKEPGTEPDKEPGKETELAQEIPFGGISLFRGSFSHDISWCEKGILTMEYPGGGYQESGGRGRTMLYFTEFGTGQKYLLCSDAYCEHKPASSSNPDPSCEATMEDVVSACIYGSNLYVLQRNGWESMILWVRDLTKKGYRKLADLPYETGSMTGWCYHAIKGTRMYLFAGKIDREKLETTGSISNKDVKTVLLEVDLTTGKYKELLVFDFDGEWYQILDTVYEKEGIYVRCYYEDNYLDENRMPVFLDYKEKFFYIPYDGTEPKEGYLDLLAGRSLDKEWEYAGVAWGTEGAYLVTKELDGVVLDRFDTREKKRIYTIGEDELAIKSIQRSGNILLIGILKKTEEKELLWINLKDGSQKRMEYGKEYWGGYASLAEGLFESGSIYSQENPLKVYDWNEPEKKLILDIGR